MSGHRSKALRCLALAVVAAPAVASADGLEFAGAGARGTMRGGAYVVGSDDAMALLYNPANLAAVPDMQLHMSLGLLFYQSCFDRDGTYGQSAEGRNRMGQAPPQGETELTDAMGNTLSATDIAGFETPEVCNQRKLNVIPELAYAWRVNDRIGIGVGVVAPTAAGNLEFGERIGGRDAMVRAADGSVLPSPGRYMLAGQSAIIAFPTLGVGIEVADRIRVGASFAWGFGSIDFRTFATPYFAEDIAVDIYSKVHVSDSFIPRVAVGISGGPWSGVSFGASYTYTGDLDASGTLRGDTLYFADQVTRDSLLTTARAPVGIATQLPWQIVGGVRYADVLEDITLAEDAIGDSMETERWNVELNVGYTKSSRFREFDVQLSEGRLPAGYDTSLPYTDPANQALYPCNPGDVSDGTAPACVNLTAGIPASVPLRFPAPVRHNWKDQVFFRLGADYNVIQGRLSVSAGVSYDSNGQDYGFEQLDFQPYRRVGAHLGLTARINRWDIHVAYAHHFNQERNPSYLDGCPVSTASGNAGNATDVNMDGDVLDANEAAFCFPSPANDPSPSTTDDNWGLHPLAASPIYEADVINTGRFRSSLDVLQLGATYHFR